MIEPTIEPIRVTNTLVIEPKSHYRPASDPYTSAEPKTNGGGARLVLVSVPRVKWLERPDMGTSHEE